MLNVRVSSGVFLWISRRNGAKNFRESDISMFQMLKIKNWGNKQVSIWPNNKWVLLFLLSLPTNSPETFLPEIDDVFPAFFSLKFQILQQKQKNRAAAVSHSFQIFQIYPKWLSIKYCRDSGWRNKISVSSITFSQSKRNSFRFNHGHLFSYFHRRSGTCVCCMTFRFDAVGNFWWDERFGQKYHIPREWKHQVM